jgi:hypothetical protein
MFTGLLIGASGVTAVYTLWLIRRLFTTAPVATTLPDDAEGSRVTERARSPFDTARTGTVHPSVSEDAP